MQRRAFLKGLGAASALPLATGVEADTVQDLTTDPAQTPRRAMFQQQAYFSFDGSGAAYTAPAANKRTVDYRASLDEEEFLRRHWFS